MSLEKESELEEERRGQEKILKRRQIFGSHVYLSHPETTPTSLSVLSNLKPVKLQIGDFQDRKKHPLNSFTLSNCSDSCTQTSKTILELAEMEAGDLSPDSLMQTPRNLEDFEYTNGGELGNVDEINRKVATGSEAISDTYTLDGSVDECCSSVTYVRKNDLQNYLQNIGTQENEIANKKSLTETFLEKKHCSNTSTACDCRSFFLQQTSPLRNLSKNPPKKCEDHFKSQSYVHSCYTDCTEHEKIPFLVSKTPRFTVKNVKFQSTKLPNDRITCLWSAQEAQTSNDNEELMLYQRSPKDMEQIQRNSRFMSPTFASEQRNQQHKIKVLSGLISQSKRGKSLSPNRIKSSGMALCRKYDTGKIPYIDGSKSTVEVLEPQTHKGSFRKNISRRDGSPTGLIGPVLNSLKLDENLLRIDLQSLELKTSEESVGGSGRQSYATSTASSDNMLSVTLSHIRDRDWSVALRGLAEMTELCRIMDPDLIYPHMIMVNQRLLELLRSPRSHVCRTACQAAGHFFELIKDTRRPEFDDIVENLLCKTADTNKFIRNDANLSLDCMVTHVPIFHAVRALCLKGPSHKNLLVRTATIRLIVCAVVITGPDVLLNLQCHEHTRKRVIQHMVKFLQDKHMEARKYGERLYKILYREPGFDACVKKYLEKDVISEMRAALKYKTQKR